MIARRTVIVGSALALVLGACALFDGPGDYAPSRDGGVDAIAIDGGSDAPGESACASCPGRAHAQNACVGGACVLACASPFQDCNGDAADGCEIDPTSGDPANCGGCTRQCSAGVVCDQGVCVAGCGAGRAPCNGGCFDLATSPTNCGACGVVCPSPANTIAACTSGKCAVACVLGYLDCDGNSGNGCETSSTDVANCGACRHACTPGPHTAAACVGAACNYACAVGYMDCNQDLGNATGDGCECKAPLRCQGTQCTGN